MNLGPFESMLLGALLAAAGGELFVRGTVGIAHRLSIPPALIATTLAAFATSSPELVVAIRSALAGTPQIALGNVLGANLVDIALVLGLSLAIAPSPISRVGLGRDLPAAVALPVLTMAFAAIGGLGRIAALVLLAVFGVWFARTLLDMRDAARAPGDGNPPSNGALPAVAGVLLGVAMLIGAGDALVTGARGLSARHGWDPFVVGATLVALGTTAPELATVIVARLKGEDGVGLGTLLGSLVFNGGLIVPAAALISPIDASVAAITIPAAGAIAAVAFLLIVRASVLGRGHGLVLLAIYALSVVALFALQSG